MKHGDPSDEPIKDFRALALRMKLDGAVAPGPDRPAPKCADGGRELSDDRPHETRRPPDRSAPKPPTSTTSIASPPPMSPMATIAKRQAPPQSPETAKAVAQFMGGDKERPRRSAAPKPMRDALKDVRQALEMHRFEVEEGSAEQIASIQERNWVDERVQRGRDRLRTVLVNGSDDATVVAGLDFGSSSTKICLHDDGVTGSDTIVLTAPPSLRFMRGPRLWRSAIWVNPDTCEIALCPFEGAKRVSGFKGAMLAGQGGRFAELGQDLITNEECAVAYLALMFAVVAGVVEKDTPFGASSGSLRLIRVGFPAAAMTSLTDRFALSRLCAAAMKLATKRGPLQTMDLANALAQTGSAASATSTASDPIPAVTVEIAPELAGIVNGYMSDAEFRTGPHMLVDVGSATLDCCTFDVPADDAKDVHIRRARVELLGADSLRTARRAKIDDAVFREAMDVVAFRDVYHATRRDDPAFDPARDPNAVISFLYVGGGRSTDVHEALFTARRKDDHFRRSYVSPSLSTVQGFDDASDDRRQFLVAYGLSRSEDVWKELTFPNEGSTILEKRRIEDRYIDKDMV